MNPFRSNPRRPRKTELGAELLETRAIARATTFGAGGPIALLQVKPPIVRPAVETIRRNREAPRPEVLFT